MKNALELELTFVAPERRQENPPVRSSGGFKIAAAPQCQPVRIPIQFFKSVIHRVNVLAAAAPEAPSRFANPCL